VGRLLDGRYRVDSRIARGGMATVYSGFDTRLDRTVAIKVMHASLAEDPEFVARFNREAKAAAALSHPNVVAVFDQGTDAGHVFLVMEYVAGQTLRQRLRLGGALAPRDALDILDPVLSALAAAHDAGLVHRDVKPENILLADDGRVKVADFGLARAVATSSMTAAGVLIGTVAYLAPEQVSAGTADARTDVYAAGILLFEMLTGHPPYDGETPLSVAYRHVNDEVPAPSTIARGIPGSVDALVRDATRREPDERPTDARAFLAGVRRARQAISLSGETTVIALDDAPTIVTRLPAEAGGDGSASTTKPPRPRRRRRTLVVLGVVLLLLLAAAGTGWWLGSGRYVKAPSFLRLTPAAAQGRAADAGLKVSVREAVFSEDVGAGLIATQDPDVGQRVRRGGVVDVHPSKGPDRRVMPDLTGKTQPQATAALRAVGLDVGAVTREYHDTIADGVFIRASVARNARVKPGTKVNMVFSKGPAPVQVPDVQLRPFDDASRTLRDLGLRVTRVDVFSDDVAAGVVVDQSVDPGQTVPRGTTVTLKVSKGPEFVAVPDVRGQRIEDARATITAAGLMPVVEHVANGRGRVVLDQNPAPGTRVRRGTTVRLIAF
ncbi:MAG: Stk1 family PASTA domain-containing Ser/Thr kinase, partial [Mycobacteriales bacterium]